MARPRSEPTTGPYRENDPPLPVHIARAPWYVQARRALLVLPWVGAVGAACCAVAAVGSAAYGWATRQAAPYQVCTDTVAVIDRSITTQTCWYGSRLETTRLDGDSILVVCRCPKDKDSGEDAGTEERRHAAE